MKFIAALILLGQTLLPQTRPDESAIVNVAGTSPWTDTGISVKAGDRILFVGINHVVEEIAEYISTHRELGLSVVGYLVNLRAGSRYFFAAVSFFAASFAPAAASFPCDWSDDMAVRAMSTRTWLAICNCTTSSRKPTTVP